MLKKILIIAVVFLSLDSCSKTGDTNTRSINGTWVFTSRDTRSFPFPSFLTNSNTVAVSTGNQISSNETIQISFDNNGNYIFSNNLLPVDKGTYSIVQDSLIIIKPDTAGFIKFNYTVPAIYASTGPNNPPPPPYDGFVFSSDTLLFHFNSGNSLQFAAAWVAKSYSTIYPSGDTLLLNESVCNFKRK